jgi:hypothetical protein
MSDVVEEVEAAERTVITERLYSNPG